MKHVWLSIIHIKLIICRTGGHLRPQLNLRGLQGTHMLSTPSCLHPTQPFQSWKRWGSLKVSKISFFTPGIEKPYHGSSELQTEVPLSPPRPAPSPTVLTQPSHTQHAYVWTRNTQAHTPINFSQINLKIDPWLALSLIRASVQRGRLWHWHGVQVSTPKCPPPQSQTRRWHSSACVLCIWCACWWDAPPKTIRFSIKWAWTGVDSDPAQQHKVNFKSPHSEGKLSREQQ